MKRSLTTEEKLRYSRHLVLPQFGEQAQLRIKNARVLVVGAGGLGCPALLYLAAAGTGRLGIVDDDVVNISNLQRQVLYHTDDVGHSKALRAKQRLESLNPHVEIVAIEEKINASNALPILSTYDIVMDATDNYAARYLLCDACALANKVLISGAVFRYEGRVAAFDSSSGPVYRDLHPEPPTADLNCEQAGVLGVVTGAMGSLMANECIKILADIGESLIGKLLIYDFWNHDTLITPLPDKNQRQAIKNLIDYEQFCSIRKNKKTGMKEVTVQELKQLIDSKADFQLIDVREPHEFDICNLGGELIPQGDLPGVIDRIDKTKKVVIHCRSGARSGNMVQWLEKHHGFTNLYNLKGGILAWADEIDTSMTKY